MADPPEKPDRYKSFAGIDCLGESRRLIEIVQRHIRDPAKSNAFWAAFDHKLTEVGDTTRHTPDELRLICSYVVYLEELFERYDDAEGLALLQQIEEDCC